MVALRHESAIFSVGLGFIGLSCSEQRELGLGNKLGKPANKTERQDVEARNTTLLGRSVD